MGCIYRIVCHATGKSYIGQTAYSHPFVRFQAHQLDAKKGRQGPLYEDLRKYPLSEFECICIRVVANVALNELEAYYAEIYDAYDGYNLVECGNEPVCREMSDERRMWMRKHAIWKRRT
jgi:group I intron endonuclease